jgi:hypothetical protein
MYYYILENPILFTVEFTKKYLGIGRKRLNVRLDAHHCEIIADSCLHVKGTNLM